MSSLCNSVHGYLGPRKGLHYATCTLRRGHEPYDQHTDGVRRWEGPLLLWDEFEHTRVKVPTVRKARICATCGKQRRTDGANDACVCREIEATRAQKILFADEREIAFRNEAARDLEEDIAWITEVWKQQEHQRIAASDEPYFSEW